MSSAAASERLTLVHRGLRLEAFTIGWNALEAALAVGFGVATRSIALTGFGLDSVIETVAATAVIARLRAEARGERGVSERQALRLVGAALYLLTTYIAIEAAMALVRRATPDATVGGVAVAVLAVVVMPVLALQKIRVGKAIGSAALVADGKCSLACGWLSGAVLLGVSLNSAIHWWWADPIAALAMVPFLIREGREAMRGADGDDSACDCHGPCS